MRNSLSLRLTALNSSADLGVRHLPGNSRKRAQPGFPGRSKGERVSGGRRARRSAKSGSRAPGGTGRAPTSVSGPTHRARSMVRPPGARTQRRQHFPADPPHRWVVGRCECQLPDPLRTSIGGRPKRALDLLPFTRDVTREPMPQTSAQSLRGFALYNLRAKPGREERNAEMAGTGLPARYGAWERRVGAGLG
jgi:hypothetical protein